MTISLCFLFFFQAEDGIRDFHVTGVQTCALPIYNVVSVFKPTILIGVSGQNGIFTEALVSSMMTYCEQPIVLPLSNPDRKSTRLNSSHVKISYAVFCLKKKKK